MFKRSGVWAVGAVVGVSALYWLFAAPKVIDTPIPSAAENIERGEYLLHAGGCISCHEGEGAPGLSGGMALVSDFGTFYAPNITPDESTGIGRWKSRDFLLALKHGRTSNGSFYFPAFPYRAYSGMTDQDVLDIAAYLLAQEPVTHEVPEHETPPWLSRWLMAGWNRLADMSGSAPALNTEDPQVLRGAYLARSLGHCGECHTPRNALGIPQLSHEFAGATMGESHADEIDAEGLASWGKEDFAFFLLLGMKPDGEFIGGEMESVIEHNTSMLTDQDRDALAAFFKFPR
ncbi:MAG: c-type cytochrome [Pseudomonadales bacterium]|nr:c-type cytochrome [Pseudomonadales bacterium]